MGVRQTHCERSERATENPENGSGRKFYILWIWAKLTKNVARILTLHKAAIYVITHPPAGSGVTMPMELWLYWRILFFVSFFVTFSQALIIGTREFCLRNAESTIWGVISTRIHYGSLQ